MLNKFGAIPCNTHDSTPGDNFLTFEILSPGVLLLGCVLSNVPRVIDTMHLSSAAGGCADEGVLQRNISC